MRVSGLRPRRVSKRRLESLQPGAGHYFFLQGMVDPVPHGRQLTGSRVRVKNDRHAGSIDLAAGPIDSSASAPLVSWPQRGDVQDRSCGGAQPQDRNTAHASVQKVKITESANRIRAAGGRIMSSMAPNIPVTRKRASAIKEMKGSEGRSNFILHPPLWRRKPTSGRAPVRPNIIAQTFPFYRS